MRVLVLVLALAGCTEAHYNPVTGEAQFSRFWADVGANMNKDCSVLAKMPADVLMKLNTSQILALCASNVSYSSTAGDPNVSAAVGGLVSALGTTTKAATGVP